MDRSGVVSLFARVFFPFLLLLRAWRSDKGDCISYLILSVLLQTPQCAKDGCSLGRDLCYDA